MRMFIRFCYQFFLVLWHFKAVFLSLIALIVGSAVVFTYTEKMPFGDALYFSFITGLTVGYGDIVAKTPFGKIIAVLLGLIGILFTGLMVAGAVRAVRESMKDMNNSQNSG